MNEENRIRRIDTEVVEKGKVSVTGLEQTVVDSIRDYQKIAGLEEVVRCLLMIPGLNEDKLKICLEKCGNGFLYQKCGYIFESLQPDLGISGEFLEMCEAHKSGSKRYLVKDSGSIMYDKRWNLYTPGALKKTGG